MFRQTEANKLVAESAQETNAIEVSDGNRGKTVGKKYRGIAGGLYHGCQRHLRLLPEWYDMVIPPLEFLSLGGMSFQRNHYNPIDLFYL
ncbi:hypothetical protein EEJ38_09200 [Vibrio cholerae]|nr:hypothetical protein EEJ38_09200 [Vibrio cholerae]